MTALEAEDCAAWCGIMGSAADRYFHACAAGDERGAQRVYDEIMALCTACRERLSSAPPGGFKDEMQEILDAVVLTIL